MNNPAFMNPMAAANSPASPGSITLFREKFKRSLRECIVRGFSVEEAFGMIWVETLEDELLTEAEQGKVYEELISWAKVSLLGFVPSNSPELFTGQQRGFSGSP